MCTYRHKLSKQTRERARDSTTSYSFMQPDKALNLQATAMRLLYEKEQESMRLLNWALSQNQALLVQLQQQQQIINQLEAELRACRSAQQSAFKLVHTN